MRRDRILEHVMRVLIVIGAVAALFVLIFEFHKDQQYYITQGLEAKDP